MKKPRLITICLCVFAALSVCAQSSVLDSLLRVYDYEVAHANVYLNQRQHHIDSLKLTASLAHDRNAMAIAKAYLPFQCDSAIHYLEIVQNTCPEMAPEAIITQVYLLASIGTYNEALHLLPIVSNVPENLRPLYFDAINRLYGEAQIYGKSDQARRYYRALANQSRDSLYASIARLPQGSLRLLALQEEDARNHQNYQLALLKSDTILSLTPPDSHNFAKYAYQRAITYRAMDSTEMEKQWLVRSAIADTRCAVTDNGSSWMLAQIMFEEGQIERAYRYIEYSLNNAAIFNARLRYIQINPLGHIINRTYQRQQEQLSYRLRVLLIILVVFALILTAFVFLFIHQNRRLHRQSDEQANLNEQLKWANEQLKHLNDRMTSANHSLQEANKLKEEYICHYLELYSEYIQRLQKMARKAGEKNPEGLMDKEMEGFYRNFDTTFLSIYPDFIQQLNALLKPEGQLVLKKGELLSTEMRIFALIRLGIDSSQKISELLCYSPNTIYNYRARVRNAAIGDRDTFEDRVRNIATPS